MLVAPFLLRERISLGRVLNLGGQWAAAAASLPGEPVDEARDSSLVLIDHQSSQGAQRVEGPLVRRRLSVPGLARVSSCELRISAFSIGYVIARVTVPCEDRPGRDEASQLREELTRHVNPLVREVCEALEGRFPDGRGSDLRRDSFSSLPSDRILWWHTIYCDWGECTPLEATFVMDSAEVAPGCHLRVANGHSELHGLPAGGGSAGLSPEEVTAAVTDGLVAATDEWLVVDEFSRLMGDQLFRLGARNTGPSSLSARETELAALNEDALSMTSEASLALLLLDERSRYLAGPELVAQEVSSQAWRLGSERSALEGRAATVQELTNLRLRDLQGRRDRRTNALLFALSAVVALQGLLVVLDFALAQDDRWGPPLRVGLALAVLVAAVVLVLLPLVRSREK
ncbi:MAG: hypothetical protein ACTHOD_13045 [Motilibacteraceae bacterium]